MPRPLLNPDATALFYAQTMTGSTTVERGLPSEIEYETAPAIAVHSSTSARAP